MIGKGTVAAVCALAVGLLVVACMLAGAGAPTPAVDAWSMLEFYGSMFLIVVIVAGVLWLGWHFMFGWLV